MRIRLGTFLVIAILAGAILGGLFGNKVNAGAPLEESSQNLLKAFTDSLAVIQTKYAREVSSGDLIESAIRGMLRTLDPHSSFFSRRDYDRLQEEQKGKYYGLGITIRAESPGSGRVLVVEPPVSGTPAHKAGLKAGDVIAKIEGEAIDDWDLNEDVIPNLKGPKGTTVNITVERVGETELLDFEVERDEIPLYTIKYAFLLSSKIGYVKIDRFAETTSRELGEALRELGEDSLSGLILDLRSNPGGALSQALEVSDRFLKKGEKIVSTRTRTGSDDRDYYAKKGNGFKYPMVVLINQNSASASEIVAGALQDHDRALIVGETSFGKALVQTIIQLEGNRGLALTTGKYYTPSERLIQRDYTESYWDYYNNRQDQASRDREEFMTDGGRVVYGGGGITPDIEVEQDRLSRFVRRLRGKGVFQEFASKLVSGEVKTNSRFDYSDEVVESMKSNERRQAVDSLRIDDKTFRAFEAFLIEKEIEFTETELSEDRNIIANYLRQEITLRTFGDEESFRITLELDRQVQTALDQLPEAASLLAQKTL
jgi:carboxyl-terminal processing protease